MTSELIEPASSREERTRELGEALDIDNPEAVPRLEKVMLNVGLGDARNDVNRLETVEAHLSRITGQQPVITRARQSVADFGIREGDPSGVKVTLRGRRMEDFVHRLVHLVLPMTKEFRGLNPESFDGRGNYSMGIEEQVVFPEIRYDEVDVTFGMDITFVTSVDSDRQARRLLRWYGLPFQDETT